MDSKKFDHFKKKLLEKKEELFQTVSKTEQYGREADEDSTQDIADKAAILTPRNFFLVRAATSDLFSNL